MVSLVVQSQSSTTSSERILPSFAQVRMSMPSVVLGGCSPSHPKGVGVGEAVGVALGVKDGVGVSVGVGDGSSSTDPEIEGHVQRGAFEAVSGGPCGVPSTGRHPRFRRRRNRTAPRWSSSPRGRFRVRRYRSRGSRGNRCCWEQGATTPAGTPRIQTRAYRSRAYSRVPRRQTSRVSSRSG